MRSAKKNHKKTAGGNVACVPKCDYSLNSHTLQYLSTVTMEERNKSTNTAGSCMKIPVSIFPNSRNSISANICKILWYLPSKCVGFLFHYCSSALLFRQMLVASLDRQHNDTPGELTTCTRQNHAAWHNNTHN